MSIVRKMIRVVKEVEIRLRNLGFVGKVLGEDFLGEVEMRMEEGG